MLAPATRALLQEGAACLSAAGIPNAPQEARWIAEHLTPLLTGAIPNAAAFSRLIARRAAHEPLAYILGTAPFRDLMLAVSPATLIPRADSETLIEAAITERPHPAHVHAILDLGTGTGCLLLAALTAFPTAFGLGIDRSQAACALARANAQSTGLAHRAAFACANWADPIAARFDLILSNPPYIPTSDIAALMPEVVAHEPHAALHGGPDGLAAYQALFAAQDRLLAPAGIAIYELGAGQAPSVTALAATAGWASSIYRDPAGHDRALVLRRRPGTAPAKKGIGAPPPPL